jgi:mRNA-degrading endonuclease RelE of RelBE toxin-antitoxin system
MIIEYTARFMKACEELPVHVQKELHEKEDIFRVDPFHPLLHTKKLKGDGSLFSFRIGRKYRTIFVYMDKSKCIFIAIGHRKDIYRK